MNIGRPNPYEKFPDLFQNVEMAIYATDVHAEDLGDWSVKEAVNALARAYNFEAKGKEVRPPKLGGVELELHDNMRQVCEWRLGREQRENIQFLHDHGELMREGEAAKTVEDILFCLRRIHSSVESWNEMQGRRGYLSYLHEFFGHMGHHH